MSFACYHCGKPLNLEEKPGRQACCESCGGSLHCCLACEFYDPKAYNECHEPQAERVLDKEKSNFCDFFVYATQGSSPKKDHEKDKARKALEALFQKGKS